MRIVAARGPDLLAVDDPFVAVAHRLRLETGEIRTRAGLAIALAPDMFARQDVRQEAAALLLGPKADEERADHHHAHVVEAGAAEALLLLDQDHLLDDRQSGAAMRSEEPTPELQ